MGSPFIVSIHIPKTAGTTLASILDRCFNRRIFYDYQGYEHPQIASAEVQEHASFIRSYFDVIHGHFFASKYINVFPGAAFIATLRHPVDRVISQFTHELRDPGSQSWYHEDVASGRMDVVEFARQDGIGDALKRHLAGMDLRDYAVLLISEHLIESLSLLRTVRSLNLEEHFGSPPRLPSLNRADERGSRIEVSLDIKRAIYAETASDNEIYAAAVRILDDRLRRLR